MEKNIFQYLGSCSWNVSFIIIIIIMTLSSSPSSWSWYYNSSWTLASFRKSPRTSLHLLLLYTSLGFSFLSSRLSFTFFLGKFIIGNLILIIFLFFEYNSNLYCYIRFLFGWSVLIIFNSRSILKFPVYEFTT